LSANRRQKCGPRTLLYTRRSPWPKAGLISLTSGLPQSIHLYCGHTPVPHFFHAPFYVYAYSFGQLLAYSLWRRYEKDGPVFAPRPPELLSRGGSAAPEKTLAASGLGLLDKTFQRNGFEVIEVFLDQLKALV